MKQPKKIYTLEEANAALPLVRAIVEDLVELSRQVVDRRERVLLLRGDRDPEPNDPYSEELAQIEQELEKDGQQLQEYVQELRQLGIELKNGVEGIVDFPAEMDGRRIYLCWKLGEPEVLYWHELDAGFRGRQPLTADSTIGDDTDDSVSCDE